MFSGTFGEAGAGDGQFAEPQGVAVNEATGDVYVVDRANRRVERFSATGAFLGQFDGSESPTGQFSQIEAVAVDNACQLHRPTLTASTTPTCASFDESNEDVYVVDQGHGVVDKFDANGLYVGQLAVLPGRSSPELHGVAVDSVGKVWLSQEFFDENEVRRIGVDSYSNALANQFIAFVATGHFGFETLGFGVDSQEAFYLNETDIGSNIVAKYASSGATLNASVDTEPATGLAVELTTDDVYIDNVGVVRRFNPDGQLLEGLSRSGLVGNGVAVDARTETVYVTDSAASAVDIFGPEPAAAPTVDGVGVSDVSAEAATFTAEINPRGASTSYVVEYGPCAVVTACGTAAYTNSAPVPAGTVGTGFGVEKVLAHVKGLSAATAYHFRVVAKNTEGTVTTPESIMTTQSTNGGSGLPDGRRWEQVSPVNKNGALIEPIGEVGVIEASAAGDALTYLANAPTELEPQGASNQAQVVSTRSNGRWASADIAVPHEVATGAAVGPGVEYRAFSTDLGSAILQPLGAFEPALSLEATEQTPYLRANLPGFPVCITGCFRPLVTSAPGHVNVSPGVHFGEEGQCPLDPSGLSSKLQCGPRFKSASSDLRHIVLESTTPLLEGGSGQTLYEWNGGVLSAISILPSGEPATNPTIGPVPGDYASRGEISNDGSRVIWRTASALYMRDVPRGMTIQLDAAESQCETEGNCTSGEGVFQFASSDGSIVYFTDQKRLTRDAGATEGHPDLYQCEIVEAGGVPNCTLSDLTPASGGEPADVQGAIVGAGEDGALVYFVANGSLAAGAARGDCAARKNEASCNLFVHSKEGTRWIATLSGKDRPDWGESPLGVGDLVGLTARVSPSGEWLAFMSDRPLTGYDNRDAASGQPDEEVYVFHQHDTGPLCVSCNPTAARPHGREYGPLRSGQGGLVGGSELWELKQWLAANIPGWTPYRSGIALYQSRYLSDAGRLYFNSNEALTPGDTNGNQDVYQFEPEDVGACGLASSGFKEQLHGCVNLLSSGTSPTESAFLDASESGSDVFFLTSAKLTLQDTDSNVDVYDAHECSVSAPCSETVGAQPTACEDGDACHPVISNSASAMGALSSRIAGNGNLSESATPKRTAPTPTRAQRLARALKVCHGKHKIKRRRKCEREARSKYGSKATRAPHMKHTAKRKV